MDGLHTKNPAYGIWTIMMLMCKNFTLLKQLNYFYHFWLFHLGEPDAQLHPKKKVWEQVMPDLRVDSSQVATYKGVPWKLRNSPDAIIKAPTVVDAQIS